MPGPIVVPVVLYHGPPIWSAPITVAQLLGLGPDRRELARRFVPEVETALRDLTPLSVDELRARALTPLGRITLVLLARTRTGCDLRELFAALAPDLQELSSRGYPQATWTAIVVYVGSVRRTAPWEAIMQTVEVTAGMDSSKGLRCALDDLLDKGRVEGRVEEARRFLALMLRERFGLVPSAVSGRIEAAALDDLERWARRLLTAPTPEAVVEL